MCDIFNSSNKNKLLFMHLRSETHSNRCVVSILISGGGDGGGLNHNTALVICQRFSFDGKACREPASQSERHEGTMGV